MLLLPWPFLQKPFSFTLCGKLIVKNVNCALREILFIFLRCSHKVSWSKRGKKAFSIFYCVLSCVRWKLEFSILSYSQYYIQRSGIINSFLYTCSYTDEKKMEMRCWETKLIVTKVLRKIISMYRQWEIVVKEDCLQMLGGVVSIEHFRSSVL